MLETILESYQKRVRNAYENYILEYFDIYGDERTTKTAISYLSSKHHIYREECTKIALDTIRNCGHDETLTNVIMEQNSQNIVLLHDKIIAFSQI